jgi:hypothetical protein
MLPFLTTFEACHAGQVGNGEDISSNQSQSDFRFTEFCHCCIVSSWKIQLRILPYPLGTTRAFKQPRKTLSVEQLVDFVMAHSPRLAGIVASDIIGQSIASVLKTLRFLAQFEQRAVELDGQERPWIMAVWQWGASPQLLPILMQWADIVGIGGCQPWLKARSKAEKQRRAENFEALAFLCRSLFQRYGPRTHIFGNCWEKSIEELAPVVASSDTSHWIMPKRSSCPVFRHDNDHLAKAPARVLSEAKGWSLDERCVESAKAIAAFLDEPGNTPKRVHVSR